MGLDINPADRYDGEGNIKVDAPTAQWSYGGFHAFRVWLAQQEGIDLEAMAGFTKQAQGRSWEQVNTTPAPLLNHSDCDGELSPDECMQILPRLKELRLTASSDDANVPTYALDSLIDVVTYCAATGVNVDFH